MQNDQPAYQLPYQPSTVHSSHSSATFSRPNVRSSASSQLHQPSHCSICRVIFPSTYNVPNEGIPRQPYPQNSAQHSTFGTRSLHGRLQLRLQSLPMNDPNNVIGTSESSTDLSNVPTFQSQTLIGKLVPVTHSKVKLTIRSPFYLQDQASYTSKNDNDQYYNYPKPQDQGLYGKSAVNEMTGGYLTSPCLQDLCEEDSRGERIDCSTGGCDVKETSVEKAFTPCGEHGCEPESSNTLLLPCPNTVDGNTFNFVERCVPEKEEPFLCPMMYTRVTTADGLQCLFTPSALQRLYLKQRQLWLFPAADQNRGPEQPTKRDCDCDGSVDCRDDDCNCGGKFSGYTCYPAKYCLPSCQNGGSCDQGECRCMSGFTGKHCETDEDECKDGHPCSHYCTNMLGNYICACPDAMVLSADKHTCHFESGPVPAGDNRIQHGKVNMANKEQGRKIRFADRVVSEGRRRHAEEAMDDRRIVVQRNRNQTRNMLESAQTYSEQIEMTHMLNMTGINCAQSNPCSHICTTSDGHVRCLCPQGLNLDTDNKTCVIDEHRDVQYASSRGQALESGGFSHHQTEYGGTRVSGRQVDFEHHPDVTHRGNERDTVLGSRRGGGSVVYRDQGHLNIQVEAVSDDLEAKIIHPDEQSSVCDSECDNGGHCVDNMCDCMPGFYGLQCEKDIDECANSNPCSHFCLNTHGSFYCACPRGMSLIHDDITCQDRSNFPSYVHDNFNANDDGGK